MEWVLSILSTVWGIWAVLFVGMLLFSLLLSVGSDSSIDASESRGQIPHFPVNTDDNFTDITLPSNGSSQSYEEMLDSIGKRKLDLTDQAALLEQEKTAIDAKMIQNKLDSQRHKLESEQAKDEYLKRQLE